MGGARGGLTQDRKSQYGPTIATWCAFRLARAGSFTRARRVRTTGSTCWTFLASALTSTEPRSAASQARGQAAGLRPSPNIRRELARYGVDSPPRTRPSSLTVSSVKCPCPGRSCRTWSGRCATCETPPDGSLRARRSASSPLSDLDVSVEEFISGLDLGPASIDLFYALVAWYSGADPQFDLRVRGDRTDRRVRAQPPGLLQARLEVRLDHKVVQVEQADGAVTVRSENGQVVRALSCVMAVPTNVLRYVDFKPGLDPGSRSCLPPTISVAPTRGRISCGTSLVDRSPWEPAGIHSIILGYECEDGTCVMVAFGDEKSLSDPLNREEAESALREYFPEAESVPSNAHDWCADLLFRGGYRVDPRRSTRVRARHEPAGGPCGVRRHRCRRLGVAELDRRRHQQRGTAADKVKRDPAALIAARASG
jgi:hypothetical protein